jgi:DNA topoisomerase-3
LDLAERETQPPKRFEDATLLNAMKYAGREIEDKALAAAMKGAGLGTPATRAETIEKLIRTGYVERQRKQLVATEKGRALIGLVAEPLKSAELTAAWEQRLKDIEEGRAEAAVFHADINRFVTELIPQVARGAALPPEQVAAARAARATKSPGGATSKRDTVSKARSAGKMSRSAGTRGRGRSVGRQPTKDRSPAAGTVKPSSASVTQSGRSGGGSPPAVAPMPAPDLAQVRASALPQATRAGAESTSLTPARASTPRRPSPRTESRAGVASESSAELAEMRLALQQRPLRCPKCQQGQLIVGRRGYGCARWREGCDFVIWQVIAEHRLAEIELRALVEQGETAPIDDLRGEHGEPSRGVLRLGADGQVKVSWSHPRQCGLR